MAAESGLALIWVHYRTPELLRESIDAARSDLAFSGIMGELVVVENGGLERDPANVTVLRPERNIGYAGGVNLGVAYTSAPNIVVMNPDVLVEPGCIPALLDALSDHAIAAPNLFLDRACTFRLPPTEQRDFLSTCVAELGRHHPQWTRYARRRWRRHAHRHWLCPSGTVESHDLSGAMLAFTRKAFETVGPWDEGYQLYFEETDWLTRAANMRQRSAFVAAAMAAHLYAQSTRRESRERGLVCAKQPALRAEAFPSLAAACPSPDSRPFPRPRSSGNGRPGATHERRLGRAIGEPMRVSRYSGMGPRSEVI